MDLYNFLRDIKLVNFLKGCLVMVDIEYESSKEVFLLFMFILWEIEMFFFEKR